VTSEYFKTDTYVLLSAYEMQVEVSPRMDNRKGRKAARKEEWYLRKILRRIRLDGGVYVG
jgi:hypothetical protein